MGNTTIIELNHDRAFEVEENSQKFLETILEQLRTASHAGEEIPGGRIIAFFPRWGQPIHDAWTDWRRKWSQETWLKDP